MGSNPTLSASPRWSIPVSRRLAASRDPAAAMRYGSPPRGEVAELAESAPLLRVYRLKAYRGFESLPLRQPPPIGIVGFRPTGEMAEWLKAHAWKACVPQGTEGSNPSLSATNEAITYGRPVVADISYKAEFASNFD